MNKTMMKMIFINCLFSSYPVMAESMEPESSNYWRCVTYDAENKEWVVKSNYEIAAINKSFAECKKESNIPSSCKTAKEACEVFINGVSTRPMWRCTALDQMAKLWRSNVYPHRDDAAIAAKAYCQQGSTFPDTCYINLMTCKNLNPRD